MFLELIRKLKAPICELKFTLSTKRFVGLIGTEKSCPMIVEINSNSIDGQTQRGVGGRLKRTKKIRPGPDGRDDLHWYGRLRVKKLTLSVINDVKSPGQSFHHRHFLDQLSLTP